MFAVELSMIDIRRSCQRDVRCEIACVNKFELKSDWTGLSLGANSGYILTSQPREMLWMCVLGVAHADMNGAIYFGGLHFSGNIAGNQGGMLDWLHNPVKTGLGVV